MIKEKVIREKYTKAGEHKGGILEEQKEIIGKKKKKKKSLRMRLSRETGN